MSQSKLVDYVRWSPNYTKMTGKKNDAIVVHHVAGNCTVETVGEIFAPVSRQASSQYSVDSGGRVGQYVHEEDRAWTTSSWRIDSHAITIEVADDQTRPWHTSEKAYKKTVLLCADICQRNGIKKLIYTGDKSGNLHMHKWYANTDCPGKWWEDHFAQLAKDVNDILLGYQGNFPTKFPKKEGMFTIGDGETKNTSYKTQIKRVQKICNWVLGTKLTVDGCYGTKTKKAVLAMQRHLGLTRPHGNYGPRTNQLAKLYRKGV